MVILEVMPNSSDKSFSSSIARQEPSIRFYSEIYGIGTEKGSKLGQVDKIEPEEDIVGVPSGWRFGQYFEQARIIHII